MTELLEKQTETVVSAGEDDVRLFLREIREFPRLTVEQERDLAKRCAEGDVIIRQTDVTAAEVVDVGPDAGEDIQIVDEPQQLVIVKEYIHGEPLV